jgi:hypothetical protein
MGVGDPCRRAGSSGAAQARRSTAPGQHVLVLLPSGPDTVRPCPSHRAQPSTPRHRNPRSDREAGPYTKPPPECKSLAGRTRDGEQNDPTDGFRRTTDGEWHVPTDGFAGQRMGNGMFQRMAFAGQRMGNGMFPNVPTDGRASDPTPRSVHPMSGAAIRWFPPPRAGIRTNPGEKRRAWPCFSGRHA